MTASSVRRLVAAIAVAAGLWLALPWLIAPPALQPVATQAEVFAAEIHRVADRIRRIPVEVALPRIARAGLPPFLTSLPLDEAVRERLLARLEARDFVDQLVPFLIAVKDMYLPPEARRAEDFETYLRRHFQPQDAIPGMEHSLFRWQEPVTGSDEPQAGAGLDKALVAQLLTLYDALFLAGRGPGDPAAGRLECERADDVERLDAAAARARPALTSLLRRFRERMEPESELERAVGALLEDAERLDTISLSVVEFIDTMVCKHHRFFAVGLEREQALQRFLRRELESPGGGRLWRYLDDALHERRHGVLVVVDGLQGHLVEALARGDATSPFVREIAREHRLGSASAAAQAPGRAAPAQQTRFLEQLARRGFRHPQYLRFFRDLYDLEPGGRPGVAPDAIARSGISTTPTISVRNLPLVLTGAPVAGEGATGIPNFHFVDRDYARQGREQGRAWYFFGNDALQLSKLTAAAGMQSLFERLGEHSSYSCAAQYDDLAQAGIDPFFNLALGEARRDFAEVLCFGELARRVEATRRLRERQAELLGLRERLGRRLGWWDWYRRFGRRAALRRAEQLVAEIARLDGEALPELLIWYDPWPDHFAHFAGPFSDEIIAPSGELARLDYWLGQLSDLYAEAGVAERTLFGMAGDHGLAPVFRLVSPEALVLDALRAEGVPLRVTKISSDEGEGPKLTNVLRPPSMRGYDVVVASTAGGNLMLDLFVEQEARWREQPVEAELRRWRPLAWQDGGEVRTIDLVQELVDRLGTSLDLLAVRVAPCGVESASLRLIGPRGRATLRRHADRIHYAIEPDSAGAADADPLETDRLSPYERFSAAELEQHRRLRRRCLFEPDPQEPESWCDERTWRALARVTPRPDSVVQLAHLYDTDRAGTINLFPAAGFAYNSIVPGRHAGESFHEKDAFAGVWGAGVRRTPRQGRPLSVLGGSIPVAIFEHLKGRPIGPDDRGFGHPSIWSELQGGAPPARGQR